MNSHFDEITAQEASEFNHNGNNKLKAIQWLQEGLKLYIILKTKFFIIV
jgi:hypothetical protein